MKPNFLFLPFILAFFLTYFPLFSIENLNSRKGFLLNANGIVVYKAKSIKEKLGIINYGDEVTVNFEKQNGKWVEIQREGLKGFLPYLQSIESDFLFLTKPKEISYAVLKKENNILLEKPIENAKTISGLSQFEIVEVSGFEYKDSPTYIDSWYEISANGKRLGYLKDRLELYVSLMEAKSIANKKQVKLNGYLLVSNPMYLKEPGENGKENQVGIKGFSKKGEFLIIKESQEVGGVKYFKAVMQNPARYYKMQATPENFNDSPAVGWISEKDAKYYSTEDFSRYTIQNSSYPGDKSFLKEILAQNKNLPLNFTDFTMKSLPAETTKLKSKFLIATLLEGYTNSSRFGYSRVVYLVVKEENKKYTSYSGNLENRGMFEMHDLDEDGIPEFLSHMNRESLARVAFSAPAFFGYVEGVYKEIPLPGNFLDQYRIKGNILYVNKRDEKGMKEIKYRYRNGQFIQKK